MQEPVGFIGLGTMGSAMSGHLLRAGYEVTGYDILHARVAEHAERGGKTAASPAQVVADAEIVITSLPDVSTLSDVLRGDQGLASQPKENLLIIDTSTLPVWIKEDARKFLAGHGKTLLDCPVSGTAAQARRRDVVAYLSGDTGGKARAMPVVAAMTRDCHDVGPFGNGMRMMIVANLLVAVHNVAAAEALVLAENAGLDLAAVLRAVGDGAGASRIFELQGPLMAMGNYADPGVSTRAFAQDIEIIEACASELRTPTPLFSMASMFYRAALAQGRDRDDAACVHAVMKQFGPGDDPRGAFQ